METLPNNNPTREEFENFRTIVKLKSTGANNHLNDAALMVMGFAIDLAQKGGWTEDQLDQYHNAKSKIKL